MKRKFIFRNDVAAGGQSTENFTITPDKKSFVPRAFGGADINLGNNKSSIYILEWGTPGSFDTVAIVSATGTTESTILKEQYEGDGVKYARVILMNTDSAAKDLVCWLDYQE